MKAIISDIHANLEALTAVMEDIESLSAVEEIICLGDIIGYGPSPKECMDLIISKMASLMGNHEEALLKGAENFNPKAKLAIEWTRKELGIDNPDDEQAGKRLKYLHELSQNAEESSGYFVHASPRHPTKEYLIPTDVKRPAKLDENFILFSHLCFVGHSHMPCVITKGDDGYECYTPSSLPGASYVFDEDEKAIVNIGSVGQPRDRNQDACYVVFDEEMVMYRRVKYDVRKTRDKVYKAKGLPNYEGDRLLLGK